MRTLLYQAYVYVCDPRDVEVVFAGYFVQTLAALLQLHTFRERKTTASSYLLFSLQDYHYALDLLDLRVLLCSFEAFYEERRDDGSDGCPYGRSGKGEDGTFISPPPRKAFASEHNVSLFFATYTHMYHQICPIFSPRAQQSQDTFLRLKTNTINKCGVKYLHVLRLVARAEAEEIDRVNSIALAHEGGDVLPEVAH